MSHAPAIFALAAAVAVALDDPAFAAIAVAGCGGTVHSPEGVASSLRATGDLRREARELPEQLLGLTAERVRP